MEEHSVAIIGENPEALLLSVLYAEAGIQNYLVGPFGDDGRAHTNRPGIEEALWLLAIHKRTGKIRITPDVQQLPLSQVETLILASHASTPDKTNILENNLRKISTGLAEGTNVAFTGLCRPRYTTSIVRSTIEKQGGLKIGVDLNLYYLPLFWTGEALQEFKEKRKILAGVGGIISNTFQEGLLQVFPTLSLAPTVELAEASGLFSAISREVGNALELELAKMAERHGVSYDEVLQLCGDTQLAIPGRSCQVQEREPIGTSIALSSPLSRKAPRLVRSAHAINEEYYSQIVNVIRRALNQCGHPMRRSKVAILGTEGLLKNAWSKPESPPVIESLRRKGALVSLYPGETGSEPWTRIVGDRARIESSLLRAVAKANCTVIALPKSSAEQIDADQLATEMNRPGAICDLTRVLEASNVERAGLFYTTIGRGTFDT